MIGAPGAVSLSLVLVFCCFVVGLLGELVLFHLEAQPEKLEMDFGCDV